MIETVSPYALIVAVLVFVLIVGFLWICRDAMRSGMTFEGEIKNRLLSMKIRTNPLPRPLDDADPGSYVPREDEEAA